MVVGDLVLPRVGWSYPDPSPAFAMLRDHVAFYAGPLDRCSVDGETVVPQPGSFYGGWITADLAPRVPSHSWRLDGASRRADAENFAVPQAHLDAHNGADLRSV